MAEREQHEQHVGIVGGCLSTSGWTEMKMPGPGWMVMSSGTPPTDAELAAWGTAGAVPPPYVKQAIRGAQGFVTGPMRAVWMRMLGFEVGTTVTVTLQWGLNGHADGTKLYVNGEEKRGLRRRMWLRRLGLEVATGDGRYRRQVLDPRRAGRGRRERRREELSMDEGTHEQVGPDVAPSDVAPLGVPGWTLDAADEIMKDLYARSGFDSWWDDIDDETQGEIRLAIAEIVTAQTMRKLGES